MQSGDALRPAHGSGGLAATSGCEPRETGLLAARFFSHACMACAPRLRAAPEPHVGDIGKDAVDKGELGMELSFVAGTSSPAWTECRVVDQLPARSCLSHQRHDANVLVPRTRSRILGSVMAIPRLGRHAKVALSRGHGKLILRYRSTRHNAQTVGEGQKPPTSNFGVIRTRSSCKTPPPSAAITPKQTRADAPRLPPPMYKGTTYVASCPPTPRSGATDGGGRSGTWGECAENEAEAANRSCGARRALLECRIQGRRAKAATSTGSRVA